MIIGLIDVDGHNFPNLCLMKLSSYHKSIGDTVEWYSPNRDMYDIVYMSKVFSSTYSPNVPEPKNAKEIKKGGTGYAIKTVNGKEIYDKSLDPVLPYEIEHSYPDYSLYPQYTGFGLSLKKQTAYGFLTRGCPRGCGFCHVAPKEGKCSVKVANLSEFWNGQGTICLSDPNFLACKDWRSLLQQLIDSGAKVEFNQGLDARLITPEKAELLASVKLVMPHFAMDSMSVVDSVRKGLTLYVDACRRIKGKWNYRNAKVFCLTNFDTTFEQDLERIKVIQECECWPYVMTYNKPSAPPIIRRLQRWTNNAILYNKCKDFYEYQKFNYKAVLYPETKKVGGESLENLFIFDCEVFAYDWLFVFKERTTGEFTVIHNDNDAVIEFMNLKRPLLCGFNNKHYDNHILKAVMLDFSPEEIRAVNDAIIVDSVNGWNIPALKESKIFFDSFDLMDDCQQGTSLKSFEAHLGINIKESEVDFNIDRPLTDTELDETIFYCKYDVDATERLFELRQAYLNNKLTLGATKGLEPARALYMTNAKLTSVYLDAHYPDKGWDDARKYKYPEKLLDKYIPDEVFSFFNRMYDSTISDDDLYDSKLEITVGDCPCTIAFGGIHGAIPTYLEEATETRTIRNKDVASYYPHLMTLMGYCSRNIPSPAVYEKTLDDRVTAKRAGNKAVANALKLVLNTTYGTMLNGKGTTAYNDLYDPLMGRSVCISGQLFLLELSNHLVQECKTLKIVQLNTDGIMVSLDNSDVEKYEAITQEWQDRTGFELEEDFIQKIVQKDVNNYIEVPADGGEPKIKGSALVRGVLTNSNIDFAKMGLPAWQNLQGGAFKINNDAVIIPRALVRYFIDGTPVEETINASTEILDFQLIAKASHKYSRCFQVVNDQRIPCQKVNRVYATSDWSYGTLYKVHGVTDRPAKVGGLPEHCLIDNANEQTIDKVDRSWYIRQAKKYVMDFQGIKQPKKNTRRINQITKQILALLES